MKKKPFDVVFSYGPSSAVAIGPLVRVTLFDAQRVDVLVAPPPAERIGPPEESTLYVFRRA